MICEDFSQFDIRKMTHVFGRTVVIDGDEIGVVRTECNFGGSRAWFECPWCNNRCAILYRIGPALKCRKCAKLRYRSEALGLTDRRLHKALKIRERLGQHPAKTLTPFPEKPDYMRWETYRNLVQECRDLEEHWVMIGMAFVERHRN